MSVIDPHPRMTLEYALKALKVRFGAGNVTREERQVNVKVQYPDGQGFTSIVLTIEQAKFLAANAMSLKDLMEQNFPANWPADVLPKAAIPRPIDRGAVPIQFAPPKN